MKFICDRQMLSTAAGNASRAVVAKSSVPALEGLLIKTGNNAISVTGYDLEKGITTKIAATVENEGSIVVGARIFCDILRKLSSETVEIISDNSLLVIIKGGKSEFSIMGSSAEEYPEMPDIKGTDSFQIDGALLKEMIEQTIFAVAQSEIKPILTGCLFELSEKEINVVAMDGFRLAVRKEMINAGMEKSFVVPGKTLGDIAKMLEEDYPVSVNVSDKHILFNFAGYQIISRLLEGAFFDYKKAIPETFTTSVKLEVRSFMDSIERTALIITDRLNSPIEIHFENDNVSFSCTTPLGKSYDEFALPAEGKALKIGFNNRFLLDALKAAGCDEVIMQFNGSTAPAIIKPLSSDNFLFLVLPVLLRTGGK